ncbi:gas vesicle protein GvpG, partial [Kitasatospora sp. NPDC007106]|uniref:gas vesicle protein GvpG n=1 Tax=Kitasatospora sp. NPDC007106 TaxID=3156914 RepID=UPI0033E6001E
MGLLTGLPTLPLAPVRGVVWVAERVAEAAEQSFYDPAPVEEELKALERDTAGGAAGRPLRGGARPVLRRRSPGGGARRRR